MLTGLVLAVLGAMSLWWALARPQQFARRRAHDRAMPWMFSGEPNAWTRKAFAALPVRADRGVHIALSVLMIVGGVAYVVFQ